MKKFKEGDAVVYSHNPGVEYTFSHYQCSELHSGGVFIKAKTSDKLTYVKDEDYIGKIEAEAEGMKFKSGDVVFKKNKPGYKYLVYGYVDGNTLILKDCQTGMQKLCSMENDFEKDEETTAYLKQEERKFKEGDVLFNIKNPSVKYKFSHYTPTTKPSLVLHKIGSEDVVYGRKDEDFEFARSQDEQYWLSNMKSEKDKYKEEGITSLSGIDVTKTPLGEAYSFELPVINEKLTTAAKDRQEGGEHYKVAAIEPWDVIDTWPMEQRIGYYRGNLLKYTMRCGLQDAQEIEIKKAIHYAEKLLETLAEKNQRER